MPFYRPDPQHKAPIVRRDILNHPRKAVLEHVDFGSSRPTASLIDDVARKISEVQDGLGLLCSCTNTKPATLHALINYQLPALPVDYLTSFKNITEAFDDRLPEMVLDAYTQELIELSNKTPKSKTTRSVHQQWETPVIGFRCSVTEIRLVRGWTMQDAWADFVEFKRKMPNKEFFPERSEQLLKEHFWAMDVKLLQTPEERPRFPSDRVPYRLLVDWAHATLNLAEDAIYSVERRLGPLETEVDDEIFWSLAGVPPEELLRDILGSTEESQSTATHMDSSELRLSGQQTIASNLSEVDATELKSIQRIVTRCREIEDTITDNQLKSQLHAVTSALESYASAPIVIAESLAFASRMVFMVIKPLAGTAGKGVNLLKRLCDDIVETAERIEQASKASDDDTAKSDELGQGDE